jgi:hypothetical protein
MERVSRTSFVSGHDISRAAKASKKQMGFSTCGIAERTLRYG